MSPTSGLTNSPVRASTGNAKRKSLRRDLAKLVKPELGSQAWNFPPDDFVRMVSPKVPRNKETPGECRYIDEFECESDGEDFKTSCQRAVAELMKEYRGPGSAVWRTETGETLHYDQVVLYFNDMIKACRTALATLDKPKDTLFQDVTFSVTDEAYMEDRAIGSGNLCPDIIMEERESWPEGTGDKRSDRPWWCRQGTGQRQAMLVCEVKNEWHLLMKQLGTYARSQFDAFPSRFFVLTIAFNQLRETVRFVIFHRSGITASHLLNLREEDGRFHFLQIFMAFMSWGRVCDAGFPDFNDNVAYKLGDTTWNITERLHHTSCIRGCATVVLRVQGSGTNVEHRSIPLKSRSQIRNSKKRSIDDKDTRPKKRRTTEAKSKNSKLNKITEGASGAYDFSPSSLALLIDDYP